MLESTPAEQLRNLLDARDVAGLREFLGQFSIEDISHLVSRLDEEEQERLWEVLSPEDAASLMEEFPEALATEFLDDLDPETAAEILNRLPSDEQTDLLTHLPPDQAQAVLADRLLSDFGAGELVASRFTLNHSIWLGEVSRSECASGFEANSPSSLSSSADVFSGGRITMPTALQSYTGSRICSETLVTISFTRWRYSFMCGASR